MAFEATFQGLAVQEMEVNCIDPNSKGFDVGKNLEIANYTFNTGTDGKFRIARATSQYIEIVQDASQIKIEAVGKPLKILATLGIILPILTTGERDALSPGEGTFIYNTTTNKLNFYNGTAWEAVTSA